MTAQTDLRWRRARDKARAQHGLLTHAQLIALGLTESMIKTALRFGHLEPIHRGVYRLPAASTSFEQRVLAACLYAGQPVGATHRAASKTWGLYDYDIVEISVPTGRNPKPRGAIVHRVSDLDAHLTVRHGIPVTKPARTLLDLAAVAPVDELTEAVDRALFLRLTTRAGLQYALDHHSRRGRVGRQALQRVIDALPFGDLRPESVLEPVMGRIVNTTCVADRVHYQHEIVLDGRKLRLDFAAPHVRGAVEVHGLAHHGLQADRLNDIGRRRLLTRHRWNVIEYLARDILRAPTRTAREIEAWVLQLEREQGQLWPPAFLAG